MNKILKNYTNQHKESMKHPIDLYDAPPPPLFNVWFRVFFFALKNALQIILDS